MRKKSLNLEPALYNFVIIFISFLPAYVLDRLTAGSITLRATKTWTSVVTLWRYSQKAYSLLYLLCEILFSCHPSLKLFFMNISNTWTWIILSDEITAKSALLFCNCIRLGWEAGKREASCTSGLQLYPNIQNIDTSRHARKMRDLLQRALMAFFPKKSKQYALSLIRLICRRAFLWPTDLATSVDGLLLLLSVDGRRAPIQSGSMRSVATGRPRRETGEYLWSHRADPAAEDTKPSSPRPKIRSSMSGVERGVRPRTSLFVGRRASCPLVGLDFVFLFVFRFDLILTTFTVQYCWALFEIYLLTFFTAVL